MPRYGQLLARGYAPEKLLKIFHEDYDDRSVSSGRHNKVLHCLNCFILLRSRGIDVSISSSTKKNSNAPPRNCVNVYMMKSFSG